MRIPSASALDRALRCPASCALPMTRTASGAAARRGISVHKFLELACTSGRDAALLEIPEEDRALCEKIDLRYLPTDPECYVPEVTLAWDFVTGAGRELGRGDTYARKADTEFQGRADVIALDGGAVFLPDFKTGSGWVAPARTNPQLKLLALAACAAYGKHSAKVEIIRIREDGTTWRDPAELDAFDLDDFAGELRALVARIRKEFDAVLAGRAPDTNQGPWCKYCPCWSLCPGKTALARALLGQDWSTAPLSDDDWTALYVRARELRDVNDRVWESIKDRAREEPIGIGDGRVYGIRNNRLVEHRLGSSDVRHACE